jgi:hypothetical protein
MTEEEDVKLVALTVVPWTGQPLEALQQSRDKFITAILGLTLDTFKVNNNVIPVNIDTAFARGIANFFFNDVMGSQSQTRFNELINSLTIGKPGIPDQGVT